MRNLILRECTRPRGTKILWKASFPLRFSNLTTVRELNDTSKAWQAEFKQTLLKIKEIHVASKFVMVLSWTGICTMFNKHTGDFIAEVNNSPDQIIQTLFYNKSKDLLIVVFVTRYDNFASLRCQMTSLEDPKKLKWSPLFRSEVLKYPGFVEFDEHNRKAITFCAVKKTLKIWELDTMTLVYSTTKKTMDMKLSGEILVLVARESKQLVLEVMELATGTKVATHRYPTVHGKKVDLIELCSEYLLIKREGERLQIYNLLKGSTKDIHRTKKIPTELVIPLVERKMFATVSAMGITAWNFEGERAFSVVMDTCLSGSVVYVSNSQNIMIICNQGKTYGIDLQAGTMCQLKTKLESTEITSVAYDEENNLLYCGDHLGRVFQWHN